MERKINDVTYGLSVKLIKGYCMRHPEGWIERKTKLDYTLWSIMDGDIHIKINGRELCAERGDVILFYPGDKYMAWSNTGCQFIFIYFSLETGRSLDLLSGANLPGIISQKYIGKECISFCKAFTEKYITANHATLELYFMFVSYLSEILHFAQTDKCMHFYQQIKNKPSADMWAVIDYIDKHCLDDLQTKQLAHLFNFSEKHFISKFHSVIGIPPGQYIAQRRMEKAAELVTDITLKMSEIAHRLGYADQYSFSKAFKKYYGESPTNFRKTAIQKSTYRDGVHSADDPLQ